MGFTYEETLDLPFTDLCNFVAIELFKCEGAKIKEIEQRDDEEKFDYFLSWK